MKLQRFSSVVVGVVLLTASTSGALQAADHLDPSPRVGSPVGNAADIADLYAWHTSTATNAGNLVVALTFAGPVTGIDFTGDPDVIYGIHIDDDDDGFSPNASIWVRFAANSEGAWGVQFTGIPGVVGTVEGPVSTTMDLGGASVFAGVREDPFFFDLQGFMTTVQTATLSFDPTRDFFAGSNVSAIVIEIPLRALPGVGPYRVWATTGRI